MEFKILCIDDEPRWVESIRGDIESHLRDLGYEPQIIVMENRKGIDPILARHDVHLVMVDYNLHEDKGDELIKYILDKGSFVELLFYSQDITAIRKVLNTHMDLVHMRSRNEVQEFVIDLCTFSDFRYKNVDVMRGLIIAESIVLETLLEKVMAKTFGANGEHFQQEVLNRGAYDFGGKYKFVSHLLKAGAQKFETAYAQSGKTDKAAQDSLNAVNEVKGKYKSFMDDVVTPRNVVAHGKKIIKDDGAVVLEGLLDKGKDSIVFTKAWIHDRREKFSYYREVLEQILQLNIF